MVACRCLSLRCSCILVFYVPYSTVPGTSTEVQLEVCANLINSTPTSVWLSRNFGRAYVLVLQMIRYRFVVLFETGIFVEIILRISLVLYSYLYDVNLFSFSIQFPIQLIIFLFYPLPLTYMIFFIFLFLRLIIYWVFLNVTANVLPFFLIRFILYYNNRCVFLFLIPFCR